MPASPWFPAVRTQSSDVATQDQTLHPVLVIIGHRAFSIIIQNTIYESKKLSMLTGKMHINPTIFVPGSTYISLYAKSITFNQVISITLMKLVFVSELAVTNGLLHGIPTASLITPPLPTESLLLYAKPLAVMVLFYLPWLLFPVQYTKRLGIPH